MFKIIRWLQQLVPFTVTDSNFWVAVNGMISRKITTGIVVERDEDTAAPFTTAESEAYVRLASPALGGANPTMGHREFHEAMTVSYAAATRDMIVRTRRCLDQGLGVMLVARNTRHAEELCDALLSGGGLRVCVCVCVCPPAL